MNAHILTQKEQLVAGLARLDGLLGIVALWNASGYSVLTEGDDLLLIVVMEDACLIAETYHYIQDGIRIQERRLSNTHIENLLAKRDDRTVARMIIEGDIWMDRDGYLEGIRAAFLKYPALLKQQKLLGEFSLFMKRYLQCKEFLLADQILDAYGSLLRAIHHWGRITLIEEDILPEITMWHQIRGRNPEVYKLYEELTASPETLKQRVELVLLACEFSVMSKMENCCSLLIRVLADKDMPISVQELLAHPFLQGMSTANIPLMLNRLARKSVIKEVAVPVEDELFSLEIRYGLFADA